MADSDYDLVPVDHDPFAVPKPGQVVGPQSVIGNINTAVSVAGAALMPNLSRYLAAQPTQPTPLPLQGKVAGEMGWERFLGPIADVAGLATMAVPSYGELGPMLRVANGTEGEVKAAQAIAEHWGPLAKQQFQEAGLSGLDSDLARKASGLYNPPVKSARPFAADYPTGAQSDAAGNLATDIEGRPLTAPVIAGRRMVGQPDVAVSPQELEQVATTGLGRQPASVAASQIRGNAGIFSVRSTGNPLRDSLQGPELNIFVDRELSDAAKNQVLAHETGHLIDYIAAGKTGIPTDGLNSELRRVFSTGVTGQDQTRNLTTAEHVGYAAKDVPFEQMAEAIRAYMTNPNYMKTVAPKTATAIRAAVNSNPRLSKIIQFNSIPALAGAADYQLMPVDHDPFAE